MIRRQLQIALVALGAAFLALPATHAIGPFPVAHWQSTSASATPLAVLDWAPPEFDPAVLGAGADAYYLFDEASGDVLDQVGSQDLAVSGGGTVFRQAPSPGLLYNGSFTGKTGVEFLNDGGQIVAPNTTLGDFDGSEAIAFRVVFRTPPANGVYGLLGKTATVNATDPGWFLNFGHGSGVGQNVGVNMSDGTNSAGGQFDFDGVKRGHWMMIDAIFDPDANSGDGELRVRGTGGFSHSQSLAALTMANCTSPGEAIEIGKSSSYSSGTSDHTQVTFLAIYSGSEAANLDATALPALHGDPQAGTAYEDDTFSFGGVVPVPAGNGLWYLTSGLHAQYPIGYDDLLIDRGAPNGFGRVYHRSWTNLHNHSWQVEDWSEAGGVSAAAADLSDGVLGFRSARKFTATGANDQIYDVTAVASGQEHWAYIYVKGDSADVSGRLIAYDESGGSETAAEACTAADGVWTLCAVGFSAASTSYSIRVEIDTSAEAIWVDNAVLYQDSRDAAAKIGYVIPTDGSSATIGDTAGNADAIGGAAWPESAGQFLGHFRVYDNELPSGSTQIFFATENGISDFGDAVSFNLSASGSDAVTLGYHRDASDAQLLSDDTVYAAAQFTEGFRLLHSWDDTSPISGANHIRSEAKDGSGSGSTEGRTTGWTSGDLVSELYLLHFSASSVNDGIAGYCAIYDEPSAIDIDEVL